MDDEIWKPIPGYGNHYEASSEGRIRVKDRVIVKKHSMTGEMKENKYKGRLLNQCKSDKWGNLGVTLGIDGKDYSVSVHKLVLLAFVGEKPDGCEACHNNGIAWDNRPENLRWDTHASNNKDRKLHGTYALGEKHPMAKLTDEIVSMIKTSGLHYAEISKQFGISRSQAYRIYSGQSWAHVKGL